MGYFSWNVRRCTVRMADSAGREAGATTSTYYGATQKA